MWELGKKEGGRNGTLEKIRWEKEALIFFCGRGGRAGRKGKTDKKWNVRIDSRKVFVQIKKKYVSYKGGRRTSLGAHSEVQTREEKDREKELTRRRHLGTSH